MAKFSILYENEDLVAVNKESGILTLPDRHDSAQNSLYAALTKKYNKIYIVHRLDRDTSGLILFAKNEESHKHLSLLFEHRNIHKEYLGIVKGSMPQKKGTVDEPIAEHPYRKGEMTVAKKGKASLTDYEVMDDFGIYSLVNFDIHSGRTHQIRVHTKYIGHPIACDPVYGDGEPVLLSSFKKKYRLSDSEESERPLLNRLALHSWKLKFTDRHGEVREFEAPLPRDMNAVIQQLRKNRS